MLNRTTSLLVLPLLLAACNATVTVPSTPTPSASTMPSIPSTVSSAPESSAPVAATVIEMTATAFTPAELTVKKGTTVTFKNTGETPLWPASAPHPTHTNYPEFDAKKNILPGESWAFTFDKVGEWAFHDHTAFKTYGKIIVTD